METSKFGANLLPHFLTCLFLVGLVHCFGGSTRILLRDKHGMLGSPHASSDNSALPPDMWFTQILDHFKPPNAQESSWQQRYQMVKDHYEDGGPVFLEIGGEGEVNPRWMVQGAWIDYAKKYKALLFQLEHRYYGQSHPTSDLSTDNLKYLSSEQALADLAHFITSMNLKHNLPTGTKWVVFGGSYPGNLAAWMRYKYPHLVHAAMSASGPVLAKVDFYEYMEVVRDALGTYSSECVEAVNTADNHINLLLRHPLGMRSINKEFRLCDPIDTNIKNDVASLLESLAGNFAGVVQYNKDNRISGGGMSNKITIDTLCDIMVNETIGTPVARYAAVNSLMLETGNQTCLDYKYDKMVELMRNVTWDATNGGRQWMYQTCTEFGYYQTAESNKKLFGQDFPIDFFVQQCADIYGKQFTADSVARAVERTNEMYGGLDLKATRVVYVHGSIDPWHALGITTTRLPQSPAIYINGTAHCANMYPPAETDIPELTAAREHISDLIGQWLQES